MHLANDEPFFLQIPKQYCCFCMSKRSCCCSCTCKDISIAEAYLAAQKCWVGAAPPTCPQVHSRKDVVKQVEYFTGNAIVVSRMFYDRSIMWFLKNKWVQADR